MTQEKSRLRRSEATFRVSAEVRFDTYERPDRANESGLSDPSASLDYTEERPG